LEEEEGGEADIPWSFKIGCSFTQQFTFFSEGR
jgi:hypothetical protein